MADYTRTGSAHVEDTWINETGDNYDEVDPPSGYYTGFTKNEGGSTGILVQHEGLPYPTVTQGLIRLKTASIPSGTISAASLTLRCLTLTRAGDIYLCNMLNTAWVVGTAADAPQVGSCSYAAAKDSQADWTYGTYPVDGISPAGQELTVAWRNLATATTTDYVAWVSGSPIQTVTTVGTSYTFTIPPGWVTGWRTSNGGMLIRGLAAWTTQGPQLSFDSTEAADAARRPSFSITTAPAWEDSPGAYAAAVALLRRRKAC